VHLYCGLFAGPFFVVFALSAILLNHPTPAPAEAAAITAAGVRVPEGIERLEGMDRARAAQDILGQLGLTGEVGFVAFNPKQRVLNFSVARPGWEATVRVEMDAQRARVEARRRGLADALHWLHKMPGPHLVNLRGNWLYTRIWRVLSDASVYLLLLITVTGVYLWAVLRAERKIGLLLVAAGAVSFVGAIYALIP
jgi:hypothetical protein